MAAVKSAHHTSTERSYTCYSPQIRAARAVGCFSFQSHFHFKHILAKHLVTDGLL